MSDTEFSDEILMAFADGELDEETMRRVEAALETDDELMARIAMFMETRAAASEALKPVLDEPVEFLVGGDEDHSGATEVAGVGVLKCR